MTTSGVGVVGADKVALVHDQRAGAAGDRRGDGRVLQLDLRVFDGGAIGLERRFERRGAGPGLIGLLLGRDTARLQILESRRGGLGLVRLRGVALERRLRLLQRAFERPPIQGEQRLSFLDVVAFLEVDRGQRAGDLRADRDVRKRFGGSDHADRERHRFLLDDGGGDGNGGRAAAAAAAAGLRGRVAAGAARERSEG